MTPALPHSFFIAQPQILAGMGKPGYANFCLLALNAAERSLVAWLDQKQGAGQRISDLAKTFEVTGDQLRVAIETLGEKIGAPLADIQGDEVRWLSLDALILQHLQALKAAGWQRLLCLTERSLPKHLLQQAGLQADHRPLWDDQAPPDRQLILIARELDRIVKDNQSVVVHCLAGCGRTAMVLAVWKLLQGASGCQALAWMRSLRDCAFSGGSAQVQVVLRCAARIHQGDS